MFMEMSSGPAVDASHMAAPVMPQPASAPAPPQNSAEVHQPPVDLAFSAVSAAADDPEDPEDPEEEEEEEEAFLRSRTARAIRRAADVGISGTSSARAALRKNMDVDNKM